jgi:hypothetical protein
MDRRFIILAMFALTGLGCTPQRAPETVAAELGSVPSSFSRVCVVRPSSVGGHVTMEIKDNGRLVSATRGRTFACWLVMPGSHQITDTADDTGPILLEARSGRQYFLHQDVSTLDSAHEGQRQFHAHLDWVDEPTATEMIESCQQRVVVNVSGYDNRNDAEAVAVPARGSLITTDR